MNGEGKIRYRVLGRYMEDRIRRVEDIEILDRHCQDGVYSFIVLVLYKDDRSDVYNIRIGARDTWLEFNGIRYETLGDFDRLASSLEREKIKKMLERM